MTFRTLGECLPRLFSGTSRTDPVAGSSAQSVNQDRHSSQSSNGGQAGVRPKPPGESSNQSLLRSMFGFGANKLRISAKKQEKANIKLAKEASKVTDREEKDFRRAIAASKRSAPPNALTLEEQEIRDIARAVKKSIRMANKLALDQGIKASLKPSLDADAHAPAQGIDASIRAKRVDLDAPYAARSTQNPTTEEGIADWVALSEGLTRQAAIQQQAELLAAAAMDKNRNAPTQVIQEEFSGNDIALVESREMWEAIQITRQEDQEQQRRFQEASMLNIGPLPQEVHPALRNPEIANAGQSLNPVSPQSDAGTVYGQNGAREWDHRRRKEHDPRGFDESRARAEERWAHRRS